MNLWVQNGPGMLQHRAQLVLLGTNVSNLDCDLASSNGCVFSWILALRSNPSFLLRCEPLCISRAVLRRAKGRRRKTVDEAVPADYLQLDLLKRNLRRATAEERM